MNKPAMVTATAAAIGAAVFIGSRALIAPAPPTLGLCWNPGGYTDFVLVASTDLRIPLSQWPAILETGATNVRVPMTNQAQFFALYGTDAVSGYSDWATR